MHVYVDLLLDEQLVSIVSAMGRIHYPQNENQGEGKAGTIWRKETNQEAHQAVSIIAISP